MNQTVSDVGLARDATAGLRAANEHARDVAPKKGIWIGKSRILWHYIMDLRVRFNPDKGLRLAKDRYGGKVDKVGLANGR
jgi:hypothetical protein